MKTNKQMNNKSRKDKKENKLKKTNPYKNHEHDGGDDYGMVDCLKCEKEMLWYLKQK